MSYSYFEAEGFQRRGEAKASAQFSDARRPSWKWTSYRESRAPELPQHFSFMQLYSFACHFWTSPFQVHVFIFVWDLLGLSMLYWAAHRGFSFPALAESCSEGAARSLAARSLNYNQIGGFFCARIWFRHSWNLCLISKDDVKDDHSAADGFYSLGSSESAATAPVLILNRLVGAAELSDAPPSLRNCRCFVNNCVSMRTKMVIFAIYFPALTAPSMLFAGFGSPWGKKWAKNRQIQITSELNLKHLVSYLDLLRIWSVSNG